MRSQTYKEATQMVKEPLKYIGDWEDFMIYVSHTFTMFKDLCKKELG